MSGTDATVAAEFSAQRADAEAFLWQEMEKLGLLRRDGWKIVEATRERAGGSELVLRPLHLSKTAPEGLECVVRVIEKTAAVDTHCFPPGAGKAR